MMCQACEAGDHKNCGQQTWCECECDDLGDFVDPNEAVVSCGSWPECGCDLPDGAGCSPRPTGAPK